GGGGSGRSDSCGLSRITDQPTDVAQGGNMIIKSRHHRTIKPLLKVRRAGINELHSSLGIRERSKWSPVCQISRNVNAIVHSCSAGQCRLNRPVRRQDWLYKLQWIAAGMNSVDAGNRNDGSIANQRSIVAVSGQVGNIPAIETPI